MATHRATVGVSSWTPLCPPRDGRLFMIWVRKKIYLLTCHISLICWSIFKLIWSCVTTGGHTGTLGNPRIQKYWIVQYHGLSSCVFVSLAKESSIEISIASALTDILMEALILVLLFLIVVCICSIIGKLMFGLAHSTFIRR